jgi:hypothetical protein
VNPTATLEVVGTAKISGNTNIGGNTTITGSINMSNNPTSNLNSIDVGFSLNGLPIENKTTVVVNMDSQPVAATAFNRQKKQSIPLSVASTLTTSDIVAKMSGVSVGKTQTYGVGAAQMATYGNIVVAVGEGGNSIAYSLTNPPTASSWVGIPNSSATFSTRGRNIAYANGTWVAVGEGTNCIAYSTMTPPVASSWVGIPTGSSFNGVVNTFGTTGHDIAYGNGAWVAVGLGTNSISYSLANPPTAESWVGIPLSFSPTLFGTNVVGITFGNGTWVATGQGTNGIAYSVRTPPTADSWTVVQVTNINDAGVNNIFSARGFNVTYANGVWLAAGNGNNTLCYSVENPPIAGSWMPITNTVLFGTNGYSLAYGNGTWVACGDAGGTLLAYSTSRIPHSSSWVSLRGPMQSTTSELINHITFNAATNTWYFLGDVSNNCMFYSTATPPVPATWVGVQRSAGAFTMQAFGAVGITTPAFTSPINVARLDNKVTFPANRMLAVGGGGADVLARSSDTPTPATTGTISYSDDDGATWAMVPGGATNAMFSSMADTVAGTSFGVGGSRGANAVAWNGEKWVAAGNGRTHSLAFSDDGGMTWTGITGKSVFSVEARDVAWNGRMWVAVGRGVNFSTAYSYDGITWMGPVDASGTPVNVFSFDIAGPTAAMSDISGGGIHVIWTGKMWVATGTRTLIAGSSPAAYYTVAYSLDGKSWTGLPESGATSTGFDMYAHGVAWNGRNYIATGRGTVNTLANFTDVMASASASASWQGLGNTVFSVWGRGITWGAKRWMATGRGTNTVAYSTNGRNWQGCGANVFKPLRRFMAMGDTGLYTFASGAPQRGVAFTYSDDGVTWDAPVVNQGVEDVERGPLYTFTSHRFTNAGATGRTGPTLSAVRSEYSSASWAQSSYLSMTSDNGIQLWTVPMTGLYTINISGAAGASHNLNSSSTSGVGLGCQFTTVVNLIIGEVYAVVVGQRATPTTSGDSYNGGGAGGGGSFIWNNSSKVLLAAAGGGGRAIENVGGSNTLSETYGINGISGTAASLFNYESSKTTYNSYYKANNGQSGGNWTSASSLGYTNVGGKGWIEMINATDFTGRAANAYSSSPGFGGGSTAADHGGGGGGGYSGGGSVNFAVFSDLYRSGGGGGSSYSVSSMTNTGTNSNENGFIQITFIGGSSSGFPSTLFTNQFILTNAITDNSTQHTALMYSTDAGSSWARVPGTSDISANGGTEMTVANGGSYSLAMNTSRTRFLVGGGDAASATRKVYFSNDGFNWRNGVSSPNSTQMAWVWASMWVGGGYNRWLVGGSDASNNNNGRIMYSGDADAVAAWLAASPATYTGTIITCFAANANFSVILAGSLSGNVILRSENGGATWATVSISTTPTGSVRSIAFSPSLGRWVAVGGGGGAANTIIYSTDATGSAWLAPAAQAKAASTAIFKIGSEVTRVIWDAVGGRFLAGGWNGGSVATLTNVAGLDATLNNNTGSTMAYSADGINWIPVTVRADAPSSNSVFGPFLTQCREIMALDMSGDFTPINTGYSVSWNSYANRFVATGNGTTPVVYSSDGGVTWTPANQQPQQQAIVVAGGLGTAAATTATSASPITYSIDGKTWSQGIGAKEIFGTGTVLAVKYGQTSTAISPNGRIWVAGGTPTSGTSCLAFSQNGVRWTAITSASTMITNVRTIAYAPAEQMIAVGGVNNAAVTATSGVGNGVWVAGGDTTNSLVFSYDGITWGEVPNSLTILSRCNACAFGNGLFVAGGVAATGATAVDITANMAYSTDGINWQPIRGTVERISTNSTTRNISSITYGRDENGRGLWVAGAGNSTTISILYSYNGIDWVGVAPDSGSNLSVTVNSIAYGVSASTGRGLWIATVFRSSAYSFIFSTNGRDGWTSISNTKSGLFEVTTPVNSSGATSIAYLNGVWYATGLSAGIATGRTLAYSYEGTSGWFGVYPTSNIYGSSAITTFSLTDMRCVATTADYIIPAGSSAGSMTTTGTASASGVPSSLIPVRGVGWTAGIGSAYLQHPTLLFGTENSRTAVGSVISSDGGQSWGGLNTVSIARSAFRGGVCNDAFWNGTVWAAVGYDATTGAKVATSRDGVSWTQIPGANIPIAGVLYSIMWNGTIWMVGGDGSPTDDANTASIAWSTNLITWNAITNTDTKITITKRIAWNGMYWVAVGAGDVSTIMHSLDIGGLRWEDTYVSSSNTNKTASIISVVNDVVWGGGRWVAVGRGNSITGGLGVSILYSVDTPVSGGRPAEYAMTGRRWTGVAGSAQLFPYGANSISWNGKRFVATGPASGACSTSNIIAWSADGISWNAYSTTKTVAPGQRWVAVGSGSRANIALSADGRVWTDVSGSALLFSDISGASAALVNTMKTGGRAIGWNGSSLVVGGARSATTITAASQFTTTSTTGRTTIPVCAFIGSGNGVMGGGTTNPPDASGVTPGLTMRVSSSVFITHMDVNIRVASGGWANLWLNTYTDLSGTQLFQVTPDTLTFSSALKWNGWSWVANFGMTSFNPITNEQYGSIWYCTDPLARVGWSVASNLVPPRILIGQGGYAALEWNGVAWLACGYDPNNNNLIYTTDKYGAMGWTAVSGIVSGAGSASFQPVCIASSSRFWVVGGSQGTVSAIYYTSDRTGATGWRPVTTTGMGGTSVLPDIRITSIGYNGSAWVCCGGGRAGTDSAGGFSSGSISWRTDPTSAAATEEFAMGWAVATVSANNGGVPPIMSTASSILYNTGAGSPVWVVVGEDIPGSSGNQVAFTSTINGSSEWARPLGGTLLNRLFNRLNGLAWTGYAWIATTGAGGSRIAITSDVNAATNWNISPTSSVFSPTAYTNAVAFVNIPISLLTTGMPSSAGVGAGTGAMWRAGAGRAQGLLPGGGTETTSVIVRSSNGAEGARWSQTYSRNFLIAVGGGVIRDAANGGGTNRMAYSYDGGLSWTTNNTAVLTNAATNAIGTIRTVKYGNGMWVAGGDAVGSSVSGNNCLAWSRDGVNWTGAGGTQIFGSAGACYAVCCNDRGRWVAVGGAPLTTAGTYTNVSGSIYTMAWSDDGMNWTPILGSRALFGIVCQGVSYGADASGVGMWTAIGRGTTYTGCAYSYDGKTWFLSQTSGSLFGTSANVLTERYAPVAGANWQSVSLSSTGQYQTAVVNDGGQIYTSSDFGVNWTARDSGRDWRSVSLSSTGQYQTAVVYSGQIYTSSNYGASWTARESSRNWRSVSLSSTGQYQTAVVFSGQIHTSSDYGVNWTARDSSRAWWSVSLSSTGQYQTAPLQNNGQIYISSDYGVSWTPRYINGYWYSISLSSTGQYQTAVTETTQIHTSSDYGINWTSRATALSWRSVSISSTGQYQTAVVFNDGQIHTSSDYGANWTARDSIRKWLAVSLSSTGQYQTAVVASSGLIYISSNFGETWSAAATDSRSLGVAYGKDASGVGMWVATAGRRDRDISANVANTMAYSYDGKLWRGITASAGLSEQAWSVAYGKDGFGVGMWVAAGYDTHCGMKWSYDGVTWNATMGASGAAVWAGMAAGRRALAVYWNGSMWLASTSDTRNGEPRGTSMAVNNASSVPGYLLYSYNGKNWLPVLAPNTYAASITGSAQASVYSVLPNPAILDFGSFYDDQSQRGVTITNTTARTVGAVMSGGVPIENVNTIVPYGRGSLTTGQVPFLLGGDSGLVETGAGIVGIAGAGAPPPTSDLASTTASLSTSTDGGITWRAVPNSTRVMTKVNKILCDETTQQIVAVGTGNYSVATSTPATAGSADGWTGVFGSRMTDTRAGLFEKYGTGASWFGGAKMWIASGRAQTRRGSSLAVSVNGTVWQDAKIVSAVAAGSAGARGGGLTSRTGVATTTTVVTPITEALYTFTGFTFDNAGATGRTGPTLTACRTRYATTAPSATWAQDTTNKYLDMTTNGIQLWTVPATGSYTIRAAGAGGNGGTSTLGGRGFIITSTHNLSKGQIIKILVGQVGTKAYGSGGGGGTFVATSTNTPLVVCGGGGGVNYNYTSIREDAVGVGVSDVAGADGDGGETGGGGQNGSGGASFTYNSNYAKSFINGGEGGPVPRDGGGNGTSYGGFGGGGGGGNGGGGGGGYSGGKGGGNPPYTSGKGGGSYCATSITSTDYNLSGAEGSVTITFNNFTSTITTTITSSITFNSSVIPYTSASTPLLTYTDSAVAFSTQVGSVAVNSQYNRAVVGGSGVQFVAGGRGGTGLVVSNDGQNWTAAAAGATTVFQSPTNATTRTGSGGFDASFGTVALTQRLTTPTTYPSGGWRSVSLSKTGQYQTAVVDGGNIWTSTDYGVTWTERTTGATRAWRAVSLSSSGQYQTAVVYTNGQIYTSSDYGVNWTARDSGRNWYGVSLSSTGQYQTAVLNLGQIYTSSDYGVNWTARDSGRFWSSVSLSSTGQYQTAVSDGGQIYTSSDYGISWPPRNSVRAWYGVSLSFTGQYQTATVYNGHIYTSSDYGINWTERTTGATRTWWSVSLSSTGQYQTAVMYSNGNIWTSSDYGVTWTERTTGATRDWISVSLSSTGQYQTAVVNGGNIYTSSDFGVTWVQRSTATRTNAFTRIKSSASGQYQLATSGPVGNTNGQLYVSSDYGRTWMPRRGLATWLGGAVSATGAIMTTFSTPTAATAVILRSTDYGASFTDIPGTTLTGTAYWRAIAATNSAAVQTAVAYGGAIYRSADYGSTWSNTGITIDGSANANTVTPRNWQDIAVSAETGAIQVTCVSGGYLYVSADTGANWASSSTVSIDGVATQTTNRVWQAVAVSANGQYGLACVNSTSASGFLYRSTDSGGSWSSSNVIIDGAGSQATNRPWQDVGMSANGKYQVACLNTNTQTSSSSTIASAVSVMVTPPGALATTFGSAWTQRGQDIDGEAVGDQSGYSVSLSADGTVVAVGAPMNFGANGRESGQVRVYDLSNGTTWRQRGADIDGAAGLSSLPMVVTAGAVSPTVIYISISSTGQYQSANVTGGNIWTSSNYGVNWTERTTGAIRNWRSISLSSTGQYQGAVAQDGNIWTSANYGVNWTEQTTGATRKWWSISLSSTGQYQSAVVYSGNIWTSLNYGVNWTERTTGATRSWLSVSLSSTGQYQGAAADDNYIWTSSNYGVTWISLPTYGQWMSISLSSTGQYQSAVINNGKIWTSSNFGVNFTERTASGTAWRSISLSSTGQYQSAVATSGNIWTSSDFGVTWTSRTAAGSANWDRISLSSTGQYQTAATEYGLIYFSRDYGFNWSTTASYEITEGDRFGTAVSLSANGNTVAVGSPYYDLSGIINRGQVRVFDWSGSNWTVRGTNILLGEGSNDYSGMSVSLSEDGKVVAVGAPLNDGAGNLTDSGHARVYAWDGSVWAQRGADIDGGVTTTSTTTTQVVTATETSGSKNWNSVSLSSTGQYQTAVVKNGKIHTSSNFGINWTPRYSSFSWFSVSLSSTGQYQTAVVENGQIYTSSDFGIVWTPRYNTLTYSIVSLSSTGQYQTAVVWNDQICTSSNFGIDWTPRYNSALWRSVSLSSTGQYQTAMEYGGRIHTSSDFGINWTPRYSSFNWFSVSLSSTGQYQTALVNNGQIHTSSDFGINWTPRHGDWLGGWYSVSLSSTGQYQTAVNFNGKIHISSDYGVNWTPRYIIAGWISVSVSSTGQYQTAAENGGLIYFSRDYGATWSEYASYSYEITNITTEGDQAGTSVSLSADGSVVAVGSPYYDISGATNTGQIRVFSWTGSIWSPRGDPLIGESASDRSGWSTSMSADGTTVAIGAPYNNGANGIGSGQVRVYKWSGSAWGAVGTVDIDGEAGALTPPRVVTATGTSGSRDWHSVAMSATGQYQTAVVYNANIWTSSDFGVTWTERTAPGNKKWNSISLSSNGQYQTAVVGTSGNIWTSNDYGVNWSERTAPGASDWRSVSLSSTGQYQTSVNSTPGYIWISSDYGVTWIQRTATGSLSFMSISLSSTGQYQTSASLGGNIWTSSDFGVTWTERTAPGSRLWRSISLSSTGQYQTAVAQSQGNIWTSSDFGLTWTPRTAPGSFSWFSVSLSSTGQYQSMVVLSTSTNGYIYTSSDFGGNWSSRMTDSNRGWTCISVSSTGQYQTAVDNGGLIYFSRDYGFTWSEYASYEVVTGGDQSGYSLSLSATGNSLAVGAPYNDAGATGADRGHVRVYDYNPSTNLWPQRGADNDGEASNDLAGWSVSLSADGSTVAFGAPMNDKSDASGNLLLNTGSVRVFTVPVTNPITYTSSSSSIADICGNLLLIKGAAGTTNIVATQGATTTNGVLTVSGTTYTLVYTLGSASPISFIYYSKNYGASWTSLTAAGSRSWSSVALSENGSTISATTNDASGGVWVYSMPDDQYYRATAVANSGSTTTPATVRAITYGNSGTGAAVDGYWVAGADASANSLAYSSNGVDWTAVAGSKTTLFNAVNGVAYGADGAGTPLWVAVGLPFVGSLPGSTAYSIAYSYNMTTWVGVQNSANFTGQGNHVAYGQDEFGAGVWVAVGQGDGVLSANLGDSSFGNSNGTAGTTVFYSYDGANWAAGAGAGVFAVSGTDVAWGVDASGVGMWVATGIGFTDPLTGVVIAGGQVAHSTNGRVWTPIRASAPITPAMTPTTLTGRTNVMPPPPASTGFAESLYIRNIWQMLGADIDGEAVNDQSGYSVALSADGTTVAIGARYANTPAGTNDVGHVRVYKYNPNKLTTPVGWEQLGADIDGEAVTDQSGWSVALSADGTTVAIGANGANTPEGTDNVGHVRVYKYNPNKASEVTDQTSTSFGPVGWTRLGRDIDGEAQNDYSGYSVALSADGTTVAIGAYSANTPAGTNNVGHVRVYKYNPNKGAEVTDQTSTSFGPVGWDRLGRDIDGEAQDDQSGWSVALSADGTTVAIGANYANTPAGTNNVGHVRVYKYNPNKDAEVTDQSNNLFGPVGWTRLGRDIDGEALGDQSGYSVALSADGTTVAIGATRANTPAGTNDVGHVRVYKYDPNKLAEVTDQSNNLFGPVGWTRLGRDIDGEAQDDQSGYSVALSADGTTVAIGATLNNNPAGTDNVGHVRVYKYNPNKDAEVTDQTSTSFGPVGWDRLGRDIDGEAAGDESGYSVALSADGTTLAIGAPAANNPAGTNDVGHVRVYKLTTTGATFSSSNPAVADISNGILFIKDGASGTSTITATQPATPPFTIAPATVQGTLDVSGTVYTLTYHTFYPIFTPFPGAVAGDLPCVAYGRGGSQGAGAPRWIVGGAGGTNVFAMSSAPTTIGAWSVVASNAGNAPFPTCNSLAYSNGVWVASNNTSATNIIARSTDGGSTWTPVTASSVSGILTGAAAVGANSFCNYSLAVADFSNDTNLRSWIAVQGTKNFFFEGGVSAVATVTPDVSAAVYNAVGQTTSTIATAGSAMVAPPGGTDDDVWGGLATIRPNDSWGRCW